MKKLLTLALTLAMLLTIVSIPAGAESNDVYRYPEPITLKVSVFDRGVTGGSPAEIEAAMWIDHVLDDSKPLVTKPEQAFVVTQILEAIYKSAATGETVKF